MDTPSLFYEKKGSYKNKVLIYIPGMNTEKTLSLEEEKKNAILNAGWKGDIYYLWWDASNELEFYLETLPRFVAPLVKGKFKKTEYVASKTGREYLPFLIRSLAPGKRVTFVAHSLGAYMLYELFKSPADYPIHNPIDDVILLGGALSVWEKEWRQTGFRKLINVYNTNDAILNWLYPIGKVTDIELPVLPYGITAIEKDSVSEVVNINISNSVGFSHERYLEVFSEGMLKYNGRNWV